MVKKPAFGTLWSVLVIACLSVPGFVPAVADPGDTISGATPEEFVRKLAEAASENLVFIGRNEKAPLSVSLPNNIDQSSISELVRRQTPLDIARIENVWVLFPALDANPVTGWAQRTFTKRPISMDLTDAPLQSVLAVMRKAWVKALRSDMNDLGVTVRVVDVPADLALEILAKKYGLRITEGPDEIRIEK